MPLGSSQTFTEKCVGAAHWHKWGIIGRHYFSIVERIFYSTHLLLEERSQIHQNPSPEPDVGEGNRLSGGFESKHRKTSLFARMFTSSKFVWSIIRQFSLPYERIEYRICTILLKDFENVSKSFPNLFQGFEMAFYKALLFAALAILFHAAYSAAEWRSFTRTSDQFFDSIPLDITLETMAGLFLAMIAVVNLAGQFKEIRATVELSQKSWENVRNRPSFYIYGHRGKAFSPHYVPPPPPGSKKNLTEIPEKFLS